MKITFIFICLISLLAVSGCSTTGRHVQWYEGQALSTNKIALLKIQRDFGGINLRVDRINGKPLERGKHCINNTEQIELLPGLYDLSAAYSDSNRFQSISDASISFTANAGKVYEMRGALQELSFMKGLSLVAFGGRATWFLWILDAGTGEVVAGTPRKVPIHWYEK